MFLKILTLAKLLSTHPIRTSPLGATSISVALVLLATSIRDPINVPAVLYFFK